MLIVNTYYYYEALHPIQRVLKLYEQYIYIYIYKIVMENEDGQLRAKENIYSKNSKIDKKFNKKRFGL